MIVLNDDDSYAVFYKYKDDDCSVTLRMTVVRRTPTSEQMTNEDVALVGSVDCTCIYCEFVLHSLALSFVRLSVRLFRRRPTI